MSVRFALPSDGAPSAAAPPADAVPSFLCRANDAVTLQFARTRAELDAAPSFAPTYTHQIFRETETIYGYHNLRIRLVFAPDTMRAAVVISYDAVVPANAPEPADDIRTKLFSQLATEQAGAVSQTLDEFFERNAADGGLFEPPGRKVSESTDDRDAAAAFEVYCATIDEAREYHKRFQVFVLFLIDGSSFIEDDDPRWLVYMIFRREGDRRDLLGYCTVYPFFVYPDATRFRVSQFLVFPYAQRKGHGARLLNAIYDDCMKQPKFLEVVVEDPSDGFQRMRDLCDMVRLRDAKALDGVACDAAATPELLAQVRQHPSLRYLSKLQLARLLPIFQFKQLNRSDNDEVKLFRVHVKQILYRQNIEDLDGLDSDADRRDVLEVLYERHTNEMTSVLNLLATR